MRRLCAGTAADHSGSQSCIAKADFQQIGGWVEGENRGRFFGDGEGDVGRHRARHRGRS